MGNHNVAIGFKGERLAEQYLHENGYTVFVRRFRVAQGEIDLIATKGDLVVFVEVKTRSGSRFGRPAEAVTPRKQRTMAVVAEQFLLANDWMYRPVRFDVVEVFANESRICHIPDAFFPFKLLYTML